MSLTIKWSIVTCGTCVASDKLPDRLEVTYVVDGGAMLQSISWPKSTSYFHLYIVHIQFIHVQRHYPGALVWFDGYGSNPSTKDETHERQTGSEMGVDVHFTDDMILKTKKKLFLPEQAKVHQQPLVTDGKGRH